MLKGQHTSISTSDASCTKYPLWQLLGLFRPVSCKPAAGKVPGIPKFTLQLKMHLVYWDSRYLYPGVWVVDRWSALSEGGLADSTVFTSQWQTTNQKPPQITGVAFSSLAMLGNQMCLSLRIFAQVSGCSPRATVHVLVSLCVSVDSRSVAMTGPFLGFYSPA